MLMTGLKQLSPLWSPYIPFLTKSLYLALTSWPVALETACINLGLKIGDN